MPDFTPRGDTARQARWDRALDEAFVSAERFDFFTDALAEYMDSGSLVDSVEGNEAGLASLAIVVNWHARTMVIAIADYLAARNAFMARKALLGLEREGA